MSAFATEGRRHPASEEAMGANRNGENVAVRIKRAYEAPAADDGYRVLIDRLWPRGRRKEDLRLDAWLKDLAPSRELRIWFGHDPARWPEFRAKYGRELRGASARAALRDLARRAERGIVTLVFGAKDAEHSNAAALKVIIERMKT
jgi:uncharacterized protein YeaO (DUF488 family)